jgi:hypothetical protein
MRLRPSSRTWLRAVTFSLGGSLATIIIIKVYLSGPAQTDFTPFAIPPACGWIIVEKGFRKKT